MRARCSKAGAYRVSDESFDVFLVVRISLKQGTLFCMPINTCWLASICSFCPFLGGISFFLSSFNYLKLSSHFYGLLMISTKFCLPYEKIINRFRQAAIRLLSGTVLQLRSTTLTHLFSRAISVLVTLQLQPPVGSDYKGSTVLNRKRTHGGLPKSIVIAFSNTICETFSNSIQTELFFKN